jgi:hypothetical protein
MRALFVSYRFEDKNGMGWGRCQIPFSDTEFVTMDTIETIEENLREISNYKWVGVMFWQWLEGVKFGDIFSETKTDDIKGEF